ncbi:MAG: ATP-binding cassette domain-containing protein [candidate division Zixibacteria bacterium]|nr:ATP-binding cassette domain-containing protein [candidate division Zixibacteria bacterium]MCI0595689.1 ATP-binding cassette domain-containing protein [candidate division Zixibacteria bacterium]
MIQLENICLSIAGRQILKNINFSVRKGETKVILGPSGSGKSSVLKIILGLWKPDSGRVIIDGEDMTGASNEGWNEARYHIGMIFQEGALFDSLSVGENIGYWLFEHTKMPEEEIEVLVRRALEGIGLEPELIDRMPDELSGGMQRRVAIARALASLSPKIMLYDEPTTGLDPLSVETITDCIVSLQKRMHVTSVVVTHDIPDALKVANQFAVIDRGGFVFEGSSEELRNSDHPFVAHFLEPFKSTLAHAFASFGEENG